MISLDSESYYSVKGPHCWVQYRLLRSPTGCKALGKAPEGLDVVAYADKLSTEEADAGGLLKIQGQPELKSEFQTSLG